MGLWDCSRWHNFAVDSARRKPDTHPDPRAGCGKFASPVRCSGRWKRGMAGYSGTGVPERVGNMHGLPNPPRHRSTLPINCRRWSLHVSEVSSKNPFHYEQFVSRRGDSNIERNTKKALFLLGQVGLSDCLCIQTDCNAMTIDE